MPSKAGISKGLTQNTICSSTGIVSGKDDYVGGICGNNEGTITTSYSTSTVSGIGYYIGGVCGNNNGTITACYCTNSSLSEISYGSGSATKVERVDGTNVTWTDGDNSALSAMNDALSQNKYKYAENTNPGTNAEMPLVLVPKK